MTYMNDLLVMLHAISPSQVELLSIDMARTFEPNLPSIEAAYRLLNLVLRLSKAKRPNEIAEIVLLGIGHIFIA